MLRDVSVILASNIATLQAIRKAYKPLKSNSHEKSRMPKSSPTFKQIAEDLISKRDQVSALLLIANDLSDQLRSKILLRTTALSFSIAKLEYISQNYSRGSSILATLFLPGIFVSVSMLTSPSILFLSNSQGLTPAKDSIRHRRRSTVNLDRDLRHNLAFDCNTSYRCCHRCTLVLVASTDRTRTVEAEWNQRRDRCLLAQSSEAFQFRKCHAQWNPDE